MSAGGVPSSPRLTSNLLSTSLTPTPTAFLIPAPFQCPLEPLFQGEQQPHKCYPGGRERSLLLFPSEPLRGHLPPHATPPRLSEPGQGGCVSSSPYRDTVSLLPSCRRLLFFTCHLVSHHYPRTSHWHLCSLPPSFLS